MTAERNAALDRLARLARRMVAAPVALIVLTDRGDTIAGADGVTDIARVDHHLLHLVHRSSDALVVWDLTRGASSAASKILATLDAASGVVAPIFMPDGRQAGLIIAADTRPREWLESEIADVAEIGAAALSELTLRTVTRQEGVKEALVNAEAEAHYQRVVTISPLAIYEQDAEGLFTELNPAGERILERAVEEVLNRHYSEVVAASDLPLADEVFRQIINGDVEQRYYDLQVTRPDGERRTVAIAITGIRDGDDVVGVHGVARDVTEERQTEQQMRLLSAAVEKIDEAVGITRVDGQLIFANPSLGRLLGFDERGPLPNADSFVVSSADREEFVRIANTVARDGVWSGRARFRRLDGDGLVQMELIIGGVPQEAGELLFFAVARDVTGQIELEAQLRRAERLASIGTLVGGVAHELNNPLHAIQGLAEIISREDHSKETTEDLATLLREADRAAKIVADLQRLSRGVESETGEVERTDLNELVRNALAARRYSLRTRNVEIVDASTPSLPPILADRRQLEHAIQSLILNAEQAMDRQAGQRRLEVRTTSNASFVELLIRDSGPGIPQEDIERIFDPFWTTKAPGEGMGLGLSLVHKAISAHGGRIDVQSVPGEGSTFRIELPVAPPEPIADPMDQTSGEAPLRKLRILIVDDEAAIRSVLYRFLSRRGHDVSEAAEGEEALRLLDEAREQRTDFDTIVSDLRMPGLNGEELFRVLEREERGMERRVIFMTGDTVSGETAGMLETLDAPVLRKPIRLEEAAKRIERHAALQRLNRD